MDLLAAFFVEKTRFLSIFFSISEFGVRVYKGKFAGRSKSISLHTFLRITLQKINIFKKTKLSPSDLNEMDDMNLKKDAV